MATIERREFTRIESIETGFDINWHAKFNELCAAIHELQEAVREQAGRGVEAVTPSDPKGLTKFGSLKPGDRFRHGFFEYIKIKVDDPVYETLNAIRPHEKTVFEFLAVDWVQPVDS